jgi:hypothetical protein
VIFESMFGNPEAIARAAAEGLSAHMCANLIEVGEPSTAIADQVDLLVVGGPTHAFGMGRKGTRQSAARQTEQGLVSEGDGLREWLAAAQRGSARPPTATFDTRIRTPRLPGSAARAAERRFRRLGFPIIAPAESFYVASTLGPLLDGEVERAGRWGDRLGSAAVLVTPGCRTTG